MNSVLITSIPSISLDSRQPVYQIPRCEFQLILLSLLRPGVWEPTGGPGALLCLSLQLPVLAEKEPFCPHFMREHPLRQLLAPSFSQSKENALSPGEGRTQAVTR